MVHISWRKRMGITLEKGPEDKNTDTSVWYLQLHGTNDALDLEDRLLKKKNWPGIKLAAGGLDEEFKPYPPWSGRGKIPNGSVTGQADQTEKQIMINSAYISRCPAGVGLFK